MAGPPNYPFNNYLIAHIALMLIAFCLLFPLGASFSLTRWCFPTNSPAWFYAHQATQLLGFCVVVASFGIIVYEVRFRRGFHFINAHEVIGLIVVIVVVLQVFVGLCRPPLPPPNQVSLAREFWFYIHLFFAFIILFLGLVNVLLGPRNFQIISLYANTYGSIDAWQFNIIIYVLGATALILTFGIVAGGIQRHAQIKRDRASKTSSVGEGGQAQYGRSAGPSVSASPTSGGMPIMSTESYAKTIESYPKPYTSVA